MPKLLRITLSFLLLCAALASYSAGFDSGLFIFILLGFLLEAGFWFGLFPIKRTKTKQSD